MGNLSIFKRQYDWIIRKTVTPICRIHGKPKDERHRFRTTVRTKNKSHYRVDHWLNSKGMQNAPQETEIESYVIGGVKQDVKKDQFKKFKL